MIQSSKLTATPSASGWVQVHEFTPDDPVKLQKRGTIYAVIATKNSEAGVEAVATGREIITRLHEEYFGNLENDAKFTLVTAVKKIKEEFTKINPEIGVIAYIDNTLLVVGCLGISALVIRNGSMVTLMKSGEEVVSVSGKPSEKDIFIMGTKAFFDDFDQTEIKQNFLDNGIVKAVEVFAPRIHASPNLGSAGFLALSFAEEKDINIEKISGDTPPIREVQEVPPQQTKPSFFKSLASKIPKGGIKLRSQNLNQATPQGRKTTLTVGLVLLSLLVVSVIFGLNQKKKKDLQINYGTKLESAISDYNESLSLLSVDISKSRELFLSSKEKLDEVKNSEYKDDRIAKLESDINSKQGEILGEYESSVENFLDLTLQTADFNGDNLASSGEDIFILDKNKKQIIKVGISSKKAAVVAGSDDVEDAKDIGSYEDRVFVKRDDGIFEITSGEEKITEDTPDLFYLYSANLYALNKGENMIYRYPGITGGFGEKSEWLAPGIEADFSKVKDMTIDGSIWLLSSSGKVSRFVLGSPQNVSLEGLPETLENPTAIYTNEDLENVYVLDSVRGRVVVLDKSGKFKVQYVADEIKNAKDLVVSEKEGKIILLNGGKLISVELF